MISYVAGNKLYGNVTDLALPWPAGIQAGDFALVQWSLAANAARTLDASLTSVDVTADGAAVSVLASKVCTGSESGNITLSANAVFTKMVGEVVIYRGTTGINRQTVATNTGLASLSLAAPSVTPTVDNCSVVATWTDRASTGNTAITVPSGYTKRLEQGGTGGGSVFGAIADDGLSVHNLANVAISPGTWTGTVASAEVVTRSIALAPIEVIRIGWGITL